MAGKRIYRLRRAILTALCDYSGYQDLDTLLHHPVLVREDAGADEVLAEWDLLKEWDYLDPLPGYSGRVCRLSEPVRHRLESGGMPRDPRLWGHEVL